MPGYGGSSSMAGIEMEKYAQHEKKQEKHSNGNYEGNKKPHETKEGFMDIMAMDMSNKMNIIIILLGLLVAMKIHACLKK